MPKLEDHPLCYELANELHARPFPELTAPSRAAYLAIKRPSTTAYEALVNQRIAALCEERFRGRQTFAEFMARRFDPSMRTVKSAENPS